MADHDHYMRLYVGDYHADTGELSTEEHGAYLLLIMKAFKQDGRLSSDPEILRRIARCWDPVRWTAIWGMIGRFFQVDGDGLIQRRAQIESERARAAVAIAKAGGKASAISRARKSTPVEPPLTSGSTESQRPLNAGSVPVRTEGQPDPQPEVNRPPNRTPTIRDLSLSGSSSSLSLRGSDPDQTRSNGRAICELRPGLVTSDGLLKLFGEIRSRDVGGLDWQGARDRNGKSADIAEAINADPTAPADVAPTMALLFARAKTGKAGSKSAEILRDPAFAFAAWCSQWTPLREELHGKAPKVPLAAMPRPAGELPWKAAEKAEEQRKSADRAEARIALERLTHQLADGKAVAS